MASKRPTRPKDFSQAAKLTDVVDMLDAFGAKRKREPKGTFNVEPWRIGNGFYVTVTMPGSEPKRIRETFATEGEAWRWIRNESDVWLPERRATKRATLKCD
jgi:hypothetical protein